MTGGLKVEQIGQCSVSLKCCAGEGRFVQVDDENCVLVEVLREDSGNVRIFKQKLARSYDNGVQVLCAFELEGKENRFIYVAKPKADEIEIKLKLKRTKFKTLLHQKDKEIKRNFRKFWFIMKTMVDGFVVLESLAYENYFLFWSGKRGVMRRSDEQEISLQRGFRFDTMPAIPSFRNDSVNSYERRTVACFEEFRMTTNVRQNSDGESCQVINAFEEEGFIFTEEVQEERSTTSVEGESKVIALCSSDEFSSVRKWFSKLFPCVSRLNTEL